MVYSKTSLGIFALFSPYLNGTDFYYLIHIIHYVHFKGKHKIDDNSYRLNEGVKSGETCNICTPQNPIRQKIVRSAMSE